MIKKTMLPDPVIITGCARSGASMIAEAIRLCGAFGGTVADKHNGRERLSHVEIQDQVVQPYLLRARVDPLCQFPLPNINRIYIPQWWREKIESLISRDGYKDGVWFYKSSKCCLVWPVWNYAFPNAKWLIVRRRTGDIISSCLKTDFMKAFQSKQNQEAVHASDAIGGWKWWVRQHEKRFVEMMMEGLNCKVIWPQRMVYGDYQQMMETIEWLGLKWNSEVLNFIDPKLWKARRD